MLPMPRTTTGEITTRVGRPRGGMNVAARIGEGLRREIGRSRHRFRSCVPKSQTRHVHVLSAFWSLSLELATPAFNLPRYIFAEIFGVSVVMTFSPNAH